MSVLQHFNSINFSKLKKIKGLTLQRLIKYNTYVEISSGYNSKVNNQKIIFAPVGSARENFNNKVESAPKVKVDSLLKYYTNKNFSKKESFFQYLFIQNLLISMPNIKSYLPASSSLSKESFIKLSISSGLKNEGKTIFPSLFSRNIKIKKESETKLNYLDKPLNQLTGFINKINHEKIFINYKKPFLCYWLLPFLGLISVLPKNLGSNTLDSNFIRGLYSNSSNSLLIDHKSNYNIYFGEYKKKISADGYDNNYFSANPNNLLLSSFTTSNFNPILKNKFNKQDYEFQKNLLNYKKNLESLFISNLKKDSQTTESSEFSLADRREAFASSKQPIGATKNYLEEKNSASIDNKKSNINFSNFSLAILNKNLKMRSNLNWYWYNLFLPNKNKLFIDTIFTSPLGINDKFILSSGNHSFSKFNFDQKLSDLYNSFFPNKLFYNQVTLNSSAPVFPGGALTPRSGSGEGYAPYRKGAKQPAREKFNNNLFSLAPLFESGEKISSSRHVANNVLHYQLGGLATHTDEGAKSSLLKLNPSFFDNIKSNIKIGVTELKFNQTIEDQKYFIGIISNHNSNNPKINSLKKKIELSQVMTSQNLGSNLVNKTHKDSKKIKGMIPILTPYKSFKKALLLLDKILIKKFNFTTNSEFFPSKEPLLYKTVDSLVLKKQVIEVNKDLPMVDYFSKTTPPVGCFANARETNVFQIFDLLSEKQINSFFNFNTNFKISDREISDLRMLKNSNKIENKLFNNLDNDSLEMSSKYLEQTLKNLFHSDNQNFESTDIMKNSKTDYTTSKTKQKINISNVKTYLHKNELYSLIVNGLKNSLNIILDTKIQEAKHDSTKIEMNNNMRISDKIYEPNILVSKFLKKSVSTPYLLYNFNKVEKFSKTDFFTDNLKKNTNLFEISFPGGACKGENKNYTQSMVDANFINSKNQVFKLNHPIRGGNLLIQKNSSSSNIVQQLNFFPGDALTPLRDSNDASRHQLEVFELYTGEGSALYRKEDNKLSNSVIYNIDSTIGSSSKSKNLVKNNRFQPWEVSSRLEQIELKTRHIVKKSFAYSENSFLALSNYTKLISKNIKKVLNPYKYRLTYLPEINYINNPNLHNKISMNPRLESHFPSQTEKIFLSYLSKAKKKIGFSNSINQLKNYKILPSEIKNFTVGFPKIGSVYTGTPPFKKVIANIYGKKSFLKLPQVSKLLNYSKKEKLNNFSMLTQKEIDIESFLSNKNKLSSIFNPKSFYTKQNTISKTKLFSSKQINLWKTNKKYNFPGGTRKGDLYTYANNLPLDNNFLEILTKKNNLKIKRRLKKMKKETRRRKKRKIFYPRPSWITFSVYKKFLNKRYLPISKEQKTHNFLVIPGDALTPLRYSNDVSRHQLEVKDLDTGEGSAPYRKKENQKKIFGSLTKKSNSSKSDTKKNFTSTSLNFKKSPYDAKRRQLEVKDLHTGGLLSDCKGNYIYKSTLKSSLNLESKFFINKELELEMYRSKDFYKSTVFKDLKRILMKSNWLRSYLNPYFEKINNIYNQMGSSSKKLEIYFKLRNFILNFYGLKSQNLFLRNKCTKIDYTIATSPTFIADSNIKNSNQKIQEGDFSLENLLGKRNFITETKSKDSFTLGPANSLTPLRNSNDALSHQLEVFELHTGEGYAPYRKGPGGARKGNYNLWDLEDQINTQIKAQDTLNLLEYNRLIYQRMQRIILAIKENLNLNGDLKIRSKKLGKNIRAFIKRDYKINQVAQKNNPNSNQNSSFWTRLIKNNIIKLNTFTSYGYNESSNNNTLLNLSQNNLFWALNKTNIILPSDPIGNQVLYSYPKKLWDIYKIREINKGNKTKKLIFKILMKYGYRNGSNESNSLDNFNHILNRNNIINLLNDPNLWFKIGSPLIDSEKLDLSFSKKSGTEIIKTIKYPKYQNNIISVQENDSDLELLPIITYTEKSEQKLITIENKLKLLGLYSNKLEKIYKNAYFRALKQKLLEVKLFPNSKIISFRSNFTSPKIVDSHTLKEKNDYTTNFKPVLYQGKRVYNNYSKIANNYSYWWTHISKKFNINNIPFTTPLAIENSTKNRISSSGTLENLFSFLFHFCAIISFVSLGGIRTLIKFYYILISKISKIISQISLIIINFIKPVLNSTKTKTNFSMFSTNIYKKINDPYAANGAQVMGFSTLPNDKGYEIGKEKMINKFQILESKSISNKLNKKNILYNVLNNNKGFITEKLNLNLNQNIELQGWVILKRKNNKFLYSTDYTNDNSFLNKRLKQSLDILKINNWFFLNTISLRKTLSVDFQTVTSKLLSNNELKEKNNISSLLSLTSGPYDAKRRQLEVKDLHTGGLLRERKGKFYETKMYIIFKKLSNIFYIGNKFKFYTYLLLLKSVDIFAAPISFIYKFFEKPGEYVVENLAYNFLVEWSSDLITTIPETVDINTYLYFSKINTRVILPFIFLKTNLIFSSKSLQLSPFLKNFIFILGKSNYFITAPFLFILSNNILKRFLNSTFLIFIQQLCEPDLDYINRQKKGVIFWDIWGEYLKQVAEENSINIYELTTDKEEQIKLLSKYEEISSLTFGNPLNPQNRSAAGVTTFNQKRLDKKNIQKNIQKNIYLSNLPLNFKNSFKSISFINQKWKLKNQSNFSLNLPVNFAPVGCFANARENKKSAANQNWAVSQFLSYQGKDTDLFIDLHPPKSFWSMPSVKYSFSIQQPIGSIVCQIFAGIFYKQISKNILVVGSPGLEKSLLIQAIAGETELKIISDNANRYALVYRGVAVGIKLLRDVFEALSVHTPCIFLIEDIHAIGERRPFLIDDASGSDDASYNKNQSMQGLLMKENAISTREALYRSSKHLLSHYKKPYKEPRSLATNHFSFTFLFGQDGKIRSNDFKPGSAALSSQVLKKENEFNKNLSKTTVKNSHGGTNNWSFGTGKKPIYMSNISNIPLGIFFRKNLKTLSFNSIFNIKNKFSSVLEINNNNSQLLSPPASSPFSVLILKEEKKLKHKKLVKEMPWFGLPGEQFSLISKYNYSIRIKVALLADLVLSNLSVKLDMITDLLVIIDSVKGNKGFVVFATTHIPYILDPALRRPGRFDETISLPLISKLFTRWSNYRYNIKQLETSLFTKYSIPLNSTFNKGITLDLLKYNLIDQMSSTHKDSMFEKSLSQNSNELINYIYKKNSILFSLIKKTQPILLLPTYINKSIISPLNNKMLSEPGPENNKKSKNIFYLKTNQNTNQNGDYNKKLYGKNSLNPITDILYIKSKNYSVACKSLLSFLLSKSYSQEKSNSLKWLTILGDSNIFGGTTDYSIYLTLFGYPLMLKIIIISLLGGKIGENFIFNSRFQDRKNKLFNYTESIFSFDNNWKYVSSLLVSYLQKRQSSILEKSIKNVTLFGHSSKLLSFNNKYSLMEAPNPPITNILLPAKRFENYKRTFNNQFQSLNTKNTFNSSIYEKLHLHQQQRLLRRLYKYPIKEFFKSEILNINSPYFDTQKQALTTNFNNSFITLAPLEKSNLTKLSRLSSINWCYKNLLYNRHRTYLINQWWNGQQGEHNAETTFLSDIDWRYTFIKNINNTKIPVKNNSKKSKDQSSIKDINIDFPDSEQFYNPRNRRWFLTTGDWNYWFNIQSELKDIYNHYIYDCFTKAYKYLDQNREIIDFYADLLNQTPMYSPNGLNERELLNVYKRFFTTNKPNI